MSNFTPPLSCFCVWVSVPGFTCNEQATGSALVVAQMGRVVVVLDCQPCHLRLIDLTSQCEILLCPLRVSWLLSEAGDVTCVCGAKRAVHRVNGTPCLCHVRQCRMVPRNQHNALACCISGSHIAILCATARIWDPTSGTFRNGVRRHFLICGCDCHCLPN